MTQDTETDEHTHENTKSRGACALLNTNQNIIGHKKLCLAYSFGVGIEILYLKHELIGQHR